MHAAAGAVEQPRIALALQRVDAAAEHRLVLVQVQGGARDAAQLGDGDEGAPLMQVGGQVQAGARGFGGRHDGCRARNTRAHYTAKPPAGSWRRRAYCNPSLPRRMTPPHLRDSASLSWPYPSGVVACGTAPRLSISWRSAGCGRDVRVT